MSTRREFLKYAAAAVTSVQTAHATSARSVASGAGARVTSLIRREETMLRLGGQGNGWHMSWGADDRQYVSANGGAGLKGQSTQFYYSRMLAIAGGPHEAQFQELPDYPMLAEPSRKGRPPYWGYGTLALDGCLYQFMSTKKQEGSDIPWTFAGAKLIYSPDSGRNWHNQNGSTPVVWEPWGGRSRDNMVFFEEDQSTFALPSVLQMGKNYEHNQDGYIYVYSPNGQTEGTMNELVMFRVPKAQILSRSAYEYFAGLQAGGKARWSQDISARKAVHTFPRGWANQRIHPCAWQPSVVYNAPLGLYMMANWGTATGTGVDPWSGTTMEDLWFVKPSYLGFWIAQTPWGPWNQVHEETAWMPGGDAAARCFHAQIAPKWIAADGKSFWLVWSDYQVTNGEGMRKAMQGFQETGDITSLITAMRTYMPYYGFNVQRVDLVLS